MQTKEKEKKRTQKNDAQAKKCSLGRKESAFFGCGACVCACACVFAS